MIIGGQNKKTGKGDISQYTSIDGTSFKFNKIIGISKQYEMIECPDLFELNGKTVLLFNPQKWNNEIDESRYSFSAYKIGEFQEESGAFQDGNLDDGYKKMDAGFDFYAPQTFLSPDGRRILLAWMSRMEEEQEKIFSRTEENIHCMTLPRELSLHGGKLCQKPIRELYNLLGQEIAAVYQAGEWKANPEERTFFLRMQRTGEKQDFCILFHKKEAELKYISKEKKLVFSRRNWVDGSMENRSAMIDTWNEIEIWSDHSSMEIFVNGGQTVFSARIFPESSELEIAVQGIKEVQIQIREIRSEK